jgi:hypothetical protein
MVQWTKYLVDGLGANTGIDLGGFAGTYNPTGAEVSEGPCNSPTGGWQTTAGGDGPRQGL